MRCWKHAFIHIYRGKDGNGTSRTFTLSLKNGIRIYTKLIKERTEHLTDFKKQARLRLKCANLPLRESERREERSNILFLHGDCLVLTEVMIVFHLLAFGFVRSRAFPSVRLPLFVQAADADSLPTAHRDVLLHEAGQHAFLGQH